MSKNGKRITANGGMLVNQPKMMAAFVCKQCGLVGPNVVIPALAPASMKRCFADLMTIAASQGWRLHITGAAIVQFSPASPEVIDLAYDPYCPECRGELDMEERKLRDDWRAAKAANDARAAEETPKSTTGLRLVDTEPEDR